MRGSRLGDRVAALLGGALIVVALIAVLARRPVGALVCFGLAVLLRVVARPGRVRPSFAVSALGVAWTHPIRGDGALTWRQVGALIVREARGGRELAVYLVPAPSGRPDADERGSFVLSTDDLGRGREEGERRLKEFVTQVLPRLPREVALDRETRTRLTTWGIGIMS